MSDWTESLRKLRSDPIRQHWETASSRLTDALNNASVDELTRFAAMLKLSDDERDWDLETDSETSGSDIGALYQDDYTGDSEEEYLEDTDMGGTDWEYPQEEATSCQYPHSEAQSNLDKALGDSGSLTNLDIHDNRSDTNTLEELMRAWGHFFNNPQVRPTETGRQATLMGGSSPLLTNSGVQYDAADSVDSGPNPSHDVKYNVRLLDTDNLARLPAASFEHTPSSTILENIQDIQGDTKAIMMQIEDVGTVEHVENVESQMPSGIQEEFGSSHHVEHVEYAKNSSDEDQCSSSAADPMEELRDELTNQCIDVVRWYRTTRRLPPEDTEINAGYIYWAWLVLKDIDRYLYGLSEQTARAISGERLRSIKARRELSQLAKENLRKLKYSETESEVQSGARFLGRELFQTAKIEIIAQGRKVELDEQRRAHTARQGLFKGTRRVLHGKSQLRASLTMEEYEANPKSGFSQVHW